MAGAKPSIRKYEDKIMHSNLILSQIGRRPHLSRWGCTGKLSTISCAQKIYWFSCECHQACLRFENTRKFDRILCVLRNPWFLTCAKSEGCNTKKSSMIFCTQNYWFCCTPHFSVGIYQACLIIMSAIEYSPEQHIFVITGFQINPISFFMIVCSLLGPTEINEMGTLR